MSLAFPHSETCPVCSTSCDDVELLRRENRTLRFLVLGSLWVAASSTRPMRSELESLDQIRKLALESVQMAGVLDLDHDVLTALFPEGEPS